MFQVIYSYFVWHYSTAYKEIYGICRNLLWFVSHLFSLKVLSKTLFSPWHQLGEKYRGGFDLNSFFSSLVVNTIMRLIGFLVRGMVIIFGLFFCLLTIIASLILFIFWTLFPFIQLFFFVSSFKLLFG